MLFFPFMNDLNHILMICMGLSFGVTTSGWGGVRAMQNSFG